MVHSGAILIPDDVAKRNAPNKGTIVAIGPNADPGVHVGNEYIFGAYAGTWINAAGRVVSDTEASKEAEFYVCQDTDLIAEVMTNE